MHSRCQALRPEQFVQNRLTPVTLHLVSVTKGIGKLISTLAGSLGLTHHIFDSGLHLPVYLALLQRRIIESLLHFLNGFLQWSYDLTYVFFA